MLSFKGRHFPKDMILMSVRWKLAYPLSYRNIEELMEERGASVDHSTVQKWVIHYSPQLDQSFRLGSAVFVMNNKLGRATESAPVFA